MRAQRSIEEALVRQAWDVECSDIDSASGAGKVLFSYLLTVATQTPAKEATPADDMSDETAVLERLTQEARDKRVYANEAWGFIDAATIVSRVDDCAIALQARPKREFLDPLNWDIAPHSAIVATVKAVLLLFDVPYPSYATDDEVWTTHWALWIIKNIDAHTSGWEWVATNEPMGLFTQPYVLSPRHLRRVNDLVDSTRALPDSHRCWHRMTAYRCLRDWVAACVSYVHLKAHHLNGFPSHDDIVRLMAPPRRTPQSNVWFRLETREGVEYFYNRLLQQLTIDRPADFDGDAVTSIPNVIRQLVNEALENDHATRLELERRGHQRIRERLLDEEQWVQCIDVHTQQEYYYSVRHFRISEVPPANGVFIPHTESVAYRAVLRLQTAYRRRRLQQRLQVKKVKRASLPVFSTLGNAKRFS
ncbi:hypothetical protein ATCC90586_010581 [Pythium insidiosum]|nr:hypothetical protein ATCC90586_010581 [Pythium insidiosum]